MKEFIIWGVPKGESEETILISEAQKIPNLESANNVCKILENRLGCSKTRVQIIDLTNGFRNDFKKAIN